MLLIHLLSSDFHLLIPLGFGTSLAYLRPHDQTYNGTLFNLNPYFILGLNQRLLSTGIFS